MVGRIDGSIQHQSSISTEYDSVQKNVSVKEVQEISRKAQERSTEEKQLSAVDAKKLTESMNTFLQSVNTQLRFKFHDELNEYYVTIVDSATDEVVREIPSKKLMDIHAAMKEFVGLLIDRKI